MKSACLRCSSSLALALFLSAIFAFVPARAQQSYAPNEAKYQALPLERSRQNHLLVRAHINGHPAVLGVDTGAPVSGIALSRRQHFHLSPLPGSSDLPPRLRINGGLNRVVMAHRVTLGALTLLDEPLVVIDLAVSARAAHDFHDRELDGILGADILLPLQAVLDYPAQTLTMKLDPDTPGTVPEPNRDGWRGVPIRVSEGWNFYVDSKLNGKAAQLMIDSGAFTTLIHRSFVRQMRLPLRDTPYTSGAVNLDDQDLQLAIIRNFSVGAFKVKKKEVGVMNLSGLIPDNLLTGSPPVAGLLGSEFLRRNHGIIDFGTRTLYLKL